MRSAFIFPTDNFSQIHLDAFSFNDWIFRFSQYIAKEIFRNSPIFHLRGAIFYGRLSLGRLTLNCRPLVLVYHNFFSFFLSFLQPPLTTFLNHVTWPELADYFLDAFDWYRGGKVGEIANTLID